MLSLDSGGATAAARIGPDAAGPDGEQKVAVVEGVTDQVKGWRIRKADRFHELQQV